MAVDPSPARHCVECGAELASTRHPSTRFCTSTCRYRHRDSQPATREADRKRHHDRYEAERAAASPERAPQLDRAAERYRSDPAFRERSRDRARKRAEQLRAGVAICGSRGCARDHRTAGTCPGSVEQGQGDK